jgi:deltex-like protein
VVQNSIQAKKRKLEEFQSSEKKCLPVEPFGRDAMIRMTINLMKCQDEFRRGNKPVHVLTSYHYTRAIFLDSIEKDGLLSHKERTESQVQAKNGLDSFGPGIYVANNPFAFNTYGDVGLLVAILKGTEKRIRKGTCNTDPAVDTVIGNKNSSGRVGKEETVLMKGCQVLPLLSFPSVLVCDDIDDFEGNMLVWRLQEELQMILDEFFNLVPTVVDHVLPSLGNNSRDRLKRAPRPKEDVSYQLSLPKSPSPVEPAASLTASLLWRVANSPQEVVRYMAPTKLSVGEQPFVRVEAKNECRECLVCHSALQDLAEGPVVQLHRCRHMFHERCMKQALEFDARCPTCRLPVAEPQGKCPSGIMAVSTSSRTCEGYSECGSSIVIRYSLSTGTQLSYHENPGQKYQGTVRTAYLPNNYEGKKLLKRLKYAWSRGLTFTIGTSLTSGRKNQIVWSSIHHKTSLRGGMHGFPDPNYFWNCNEDLDALQVPPADSF